MAAAVERSSAAARKTDRVGVVAIVHDQATLDRIQGVIRELQLDDELGFEATLDATLRRIHEGFSPRVLVIDLSESPAPISELSAARAVGGADLKILALGTINDVGVYRDMIAAGATDYLVKPPGREQLTAILEKNHGGGGSGGLGQVIAFLGSRGGGSAQRRRPWPAPGFSPKIARSAAPWSISTCIMAPLR
jgi:pilus assembly protein CpaE